MSSLRYLRWVERGSSLAWGRISDEVTARRTLHGEAHVQARPGQVVASHFGRRFPATPSPFVTKTDWQTEVLRRLIEHLDRAMPGEFFLASARVGNLPRIAVMDTAWAWLPRELDTLGLLASRPSRLRALNNWGVIGEPAAHLEDAAVYIVFDPICSAPGEPAFVHGPDAGVLIERWVNVEGELTPASGRAAPRINSGTVRRVMSPRTRGIDAPMPTALEQPDIGEVTFPIDAVYTWVDGSDASWRAARDEFLRRENPGAFTESSADQSRFADHEELRYSLRSIEENAPWIRHVYVVTAGQRPAWLAENHPRLTVVDHREIFPPELDALPTFNSHAIESVLHRVPGLAEHFLYLNDDVAFSSPTAPETFFVANGLARFAQSRAQIADGDPQANEPASDSSGKNARELILEACGRRVNRKLFHTPLALQRSVAEELWESYPAEASATVRARFRTIADFQFAGNLHLHYAYSQGRAVIGRIPYRYVDVGASSASVELGRLYDARHSIGVYCLNEASADLTPREIEATMRAFYERMHPNISSFENTGR